MKQSALKFELPIALSEEDFFITPNNKEAFDAIKSFWNKSFFGFNIYGPQGSGKTHLAHIFATQNKGIIINAHDVDMNNFDTFFYKNNILIIEDVDENINYEAMFHLYNIYKNEGGYILFTSLKPLHQIITPIKDLNSRFGAVAGVEIKEPDDILLNALLVKLCFDRGLEISPDILEFIIKRCERSFYYIKQLVTELDTLSMERKKAISLAMVKEVMNFLEDNLQQELF